MNDEQVNGQAFGDPHVVYPGQTPIGVVVEDYLNNDWDYFWLLVTERENGYGYCSFGSLLPYLVGRTEHIIHHEGECIICSGLDPVFWLDPERLIPQVLEDKAISSRLVGDLPLADLLVIDVQGESLSREAFKAAVYDYWQEVVGVSLNGELKVIRILKVKSLEMDARPRF